MPNHFHIMVYIREIEIDIMSIGVVKNNTDAKEVKRRTINQSIGIMLRSYSQAVNRQQNYSGKLIREKTKAECIDCVNGISPSFISQNGIATINNTLTENKYPQICFNYIHLNPVKANLVKNVNDWEFSSAKDYSNLRNGTLINKQTAKQFIEFK
jgi:putative transposase